MCTRPLLVCTRHRPTRIKYNPSTAEASRPDEPLWTPNMSGTSGKKKALATAPALAPRSLALHSPLLIIRIRFLPLTILFSSTSPPSKLWPFSQSSQPRSRRTPTLAVSRISCPSAARLKQPTRRPFSPAFRCEPLSPLQNPFPRVTRQPPSLCPSKISKSAVRRRCSLCLPLPIFSSSPVVAAPPWAVVGLLACCYCQRGPRQDAKLARAPTHEICKTAGPC